MVNVGCLILFAGCVSLLWICVWCVCVFGWALSVMLFSGGCSLLFVLFGFGGGLLVFSVCVSLLWVLEPVALVVYVD